MELTTEDLERIEQKINERCVDTGILMKGTIGYRAVFEVAEYCTRYEREQQIKTLNRPGSKYYVSYDPDYKDKVFGVFNKEDLTQQGAQKMAQQLNNLKAEYHALCERTREPLAREEDLHKYRNALQTCHDREKKLEAEHTELIRRIKSILKASTVHDKISILEELEQLLNSLKK